MMAEAFFAKQDGDRFGSVVNVSSEAAHLLPESDPAMAALPIAAHTVTKNDGPLAVRLIASNADLARMQVVDFHPGVAFTHESILEGSSLEPGMIPFDDLSLPGPAVCGVHRRRRAFCMAGSSGHRVMWVS